MLWTSNGHYQARPKPKWLRILGWSYLCYIAVLVFSSLLEFLAPFPIRGLFPFPLGHLLLSFQILFPQSYRQLLSTEFFSVPFYKLDNLIVYADLLLIICGFLFIISATYIAFRKKNDNNFSRIESWFMFASIVSVTFFILPVMLLNASDRLATTRQQAQLEKKFATINPPIKSILSAMQVASPEITSYACGVSGYTAKVEDCSEINIFTNLSADELDAAYVSSKTSYLIKIHETWGTINQLNYQVNFYGVHRKNKNIFCLGYNDRDFRIQNKEEKFEILLNAQELKLSKVPTLYCYKSPEKVLPMIL